MHELRGWLVRARVVALVALLLVPACSSMPLFGGRDGTDPGAVEPGQEVVADDADAISPTAADAAGTAPDDDVEFAGPPRSSGRVLDVDEAELERDRELVTKLRGRNLTAHASARGVVITLPDVLFEFGSADLTGEARRRIQDIADILHRDARGRKVAVEGHTDSIGAELYNQGLSQRRARAVSQALVGAGVAEGLISQKGYGSTFPIAPNTNTDGSDNPAGRARNRRVEIVILN